MWSKLRWAARSASWNCLMARAASSSACLSDEGTARLAAVTSSAGTRSLGDWTPSKRRVRSSTAASPPALTAARISRTGCTGPSPTGAGAGNTDLEISVHAAQVKASEQLRHRPRCYSCRQDGL